MTARRYENDENERTDGRGDEGPVRAKRSLGQNFLVDENVCRKIVAALEIGSGDRVLEIGPGRGALTRWIEGSGPAAYTVLEKDERLAPLIAERWPDIDVRRTDALTFPWETLEDGWKIAGNLPYNIGSKLIWDIVSRGRGWERCVFMVQHEVALRLTAAPSTKDYGALTVWVRNYADTRYLFKVPPHVFRPQPKVDSAVVLFLPRPENTRPQCPRALSGLLRLCFQKRRKQLHNILKSLWSDSIDQWLEEQGLRRSDRPENVAPEQFSALSQIMKSHFPT